MKKGIKHKSKGIHRKTKRKKKERQNEKEIKNERVRGRQRKAFLLTYSF